MYREERSSLSSDEVLNVNLSSADAEQPFARRRISKVVVAHNENLETFYDFHESFASHEKGGTSFDDFYINVNGESGFFEQSLAAYGQEDEPCPRCGTPIKRITFGARSSHFCPRCQKR